MPKAARSTYGGFLPWKKLSSKNTDDRDEPIVQAICEIKRVSPAECEIYKKYIRDMLPQAREFVNSNLPFTVLFGKHWREEIHFFVQDNYYEPFCICKYCTKLRKKWGDQLEVEKEENKKKEEEKQRVAAATITVELYCGNEVQVNPKPVDKMVAIHFEEGSEWFF